MCQNPFVDVNNRLVDEERKVTCPQCGRNKKQAEKVAEQKILGKATVELWLDSQGGGGIGGLSPSMDLDCT